MYCIATDSNIAEHIKYVLELDAEVMMLYI